MENKLTLSGLIYPISISLLFIDISCFTFIGIDIIFSLLAFYGVVLFNANIRLLKIFFLWFLLSARSFLFNGPDNWFVIHLTILTLALMSFQLFLSKTSLMTYFFIVLFITVQELVIEPYFMGTEIIICYTFYKIFATMCLVVIFLKFLAKGNLDNRLKL